MLLINNISCSTDEVIRALLYFVLLNAAKDNILFKNWIPDYIYILVTVVIRCRLVCTYLTLPAWLNRMLLNTFPPIF